MGFRSFNCRTTPGARRGGAALALVLAAALSLAASASASSSRVPRTKPAALLTQAGSLAQGLQKDDRVGVVVYAPPKLSGQLKCEALVESIRSQGKWGGRLFLITEQLKCYQHVRWTQCGLDAEIIDLDDGLDAHEDQQQQAPSSGEAQGSSTSTTGSTTGSISSNSSSSTGAAGGSRHHHRGGLSRWWHGVFGPSAHEVERGRLVRSQLWELLQPPPEMEMLVYIHGCDQLMGAPLLPFAKDALATYSRKQQGARPMLVVAPPAPPAPVVHSTSSASSSSASTGWSPFWDEEDGSSEVIQDSLVDIRTRQQQVVLSGSSKADTTQAADSEQQQQQQQQAEAQEDDQEQEEQAGGSHAAVARGAVWAIHRRHSAALLDAWRDAVRDAHLRQQRLREQRLRLPASGAELEERVHRGVRRLGRQLSPAEEQQRREDEEERGMLEAAVARAWAKQHGREQPQEQEPQPEPGLGREAAQADGQVQAGPGGQAQQQVAGWGEAEEDDVCARTGAACAAKYVRRAAGWSRALGCDKLEGCDMTVAPAVFNYVPASLCARYDHEMVADWVTTLDLCVVQELGWCLPAHMVPFARGWLPYPTCAKMELGLSRVSCQWSCTEPTVVRSPGFRTSVIARTLTWP